VGVARQATLVPVTSGNMWVKGLYQAGRAPSRFARARRVNDATNRVPGTKSFGAAGRNGSRVLSLL